MEPVYLLCRRIVMRSRRSRQARRLGALARQLRPRCIAAVEESAAIGESALAVDEVEMELEPEPEPPARKVRRVAAAALDAAERAALAQRVIEAGAPVVLAGAAAHWPAAQLWSVEHLASRLGRHPVDVSLGVEETSAPTVKRTLEFEQLARQICGRERAPGCTCQQQPYLKQADLFRLAPSLREEIELEELLAARRVCSRTHYCWVGPAGAETGLHNDDEDNFLAQVRGRKRVLLFEPGEREHLYVNDKYDSGTECCDVDPSSPDLAAHPLFARARPPWSATLSEGDVLLIPKFWYHHVTSLSPTISVNLFFSTAREFAAHGLVRHAREVLHAVGLLGRGNCVCCAAARANT